MNGPFREMFEGLRDAATALIEAHEALAHVSAIMVKANEGIKRTADAALHAHEEHEDLRETVRRLEALVMELIAKQNGDAGRGSDHA